MLPPRGLVISGVSLAVLAAIIGAAAGAGLVAATVYSSPFPGYFSETVTVPADATPSNPYVAGFHGTTFSMSWPKIPQGLSTGELGMEFNITEPSGGLEVTATGCADCDSSLHAWYSADGAVGVGWHDNAFGDPTLLVRQ